MTIALITATQPLCGNNAAVLYCNLRKRRRRLHILLNCEAARVWRSENITPCKLSHKSVLGTQQESAYSCLAQLGLDSATAELGFRGCGVGELFVLIDNLRRMIDPSRLIPRVDPSKAASLRSSGPRAQESPRLEQKKDPLCPRDEDLPHKCASLSVIFPAFNEEEGIGTLIEFARRVLPDLAETWEIIVVDDGSQDATGAICDELAAAHPQVCAIHHSTNLGYGAALRSGIIAAKHDLIFFTDSDGQFDLKELRQLIRWSDEYQIVAGYRKKRRDPPHRLINALAWNVLVRIVLGLKVRDIDCAFKLFRREVFNHVQIRSVGAMVNTEILAQAMRLGIRMHEVEVTHFPRQHGKPSGANVRVILKAFRELIRLGRHLRRVPQGQTGLVSTVERL